MISLKKITLLLSSVLLALTFCSFTDDNSESSVLVKSMTNSTLTGTNTPIKYTYNGNKIVKTGAIAFTYTGNFITKVTSLVDCNVECVEYIYDASGRLIMETVKRNKGEETLLELEEVYSYAYSTDGTIVVHSQDYLDGVAAMDGETIKFIVKNGNVVREEHFDADGVSRELVLYEYDNKNTIFKNVLGADKLIVARNYGDNNANNVVKTTRINGSSSNITVSSYKYNSQGYPQSVLNKEVSTLEGETPIISVSRIFYGY